MASESVLELVLVDVVLETQRGVLGGTVEPKLDDEAAPRPELDDVPDWAVTSQHARGLGADGVIGEQRLDPHPSLFRERAAVLILDHPQDVLQTLVALARSERLDDVHPAQDQVVPNPGGELRRGRLGRRRLSVRKPRVGVRIRKPDEVRRPLLIKSHSTLDLVDPRAGSVGIAVI